jgi:hypothetical protein
VILLTVAFALLGERVLASARSLPSAARAAVLGLAIAPMAFAMGAPLPIGLSAVSARAPGRLPWLWAVTGATSVVGSVLATMTGLHFGIRAVLLAGAGVYGVILLLSRRVVPG